MSVAVSAVVAVAVTVAVTNSVVYALPTHTSCLYDPPRFADLFTCILYPLHIAGGPDRTDARSSAENLVLVCKLTGGSRAGRGTGGRGQGGIT